MNHWIENNLEDNLHIVKKKSLEVQHTFLVCGFYDDESRGILIVMV
jgi:hypothetical protein